MNRVHQVLYDVIELDLDSYLMAHSHSRIKVHNKHGIHLPN